MTEPRQVELRPCGYTAKCSAPQCRRCATTILRYLDKQGRPGRQTEACDSHASTLCAELRVIGRRRRSRIGQFLASYSFRGGIVGATSIQDSWRTGVSGAMLHWGNTLHATSVNRC